MNFFIKSFCRSRLNACTQAMSPDVMTQPAETPSVEKAPFVAGEPKQLLILAYQRTGSTFFGKIFDHDQDALYVYEPLDGLYGSMYGTRHGWVVPTDIYHRPDGSTRSVARTTEQRMTCNPLAKNLLNSIAILWNSVEFYRVQ